MMEESARGRGMKPEACRSVERQATRMLQMMHRLGVDPGAMIRLRRGEAYAEARARCFGCITTGECLRWLDGYALDGEPPAFCPNLQLFRILQGRTMRMQLQEGAAQAGTSGRVCGGQPAQQEKAAAAGPN
jgi:Family of unknown function (DUF6455)